jgi:chromosome segregation ATPase
MQRTLELKSQFEGEVQRCKALIEDLETKLEMVLQENSQLNEALTLQENEHRRIVDVHQKEINEIHQKVQIILRENDQMKESLRRHEEERMQLALVIKRLEEENSRFEELLRSKGMTIEQITTELKESRERNAKGEMRFGDYQNELLRDIDALKRENNRLLEVVESQRREISELNGRMLRNIEDVKMARSYLGDMKSSRTEGGLTSRIGWDRNLDENERTVGRHRGLDLSERINLTLRK